MLDRGVPVLCQIFLDSTADLTSANMDAPAKTPTWYGGWFKNQRVCRPQRWPCTRSSNGDVLVIINTAGLKEVVLMLVVGRATSSTIPAHFGFHTGCLPDDG